MSWHKKFTNATKSIFGQNPYTVNINMMQKAGFQIVRTDKLDERTAKGAAVLNLINYKTPEDANTPEKKMEFYADTFEFVYNSVYKAMNMIYLRSGSNQIIGELTTILEKCRVWYDIALEATQHRLTTLNKELEQAEKTQKPNLTIQLKNKKEQNVRNFFTVWINMFMKPKISIMGNMCWIDKDVDIPETIAIQTTQPIQLDRINMGGSGVSQANSNSDTAPKGKKHETV